jgi:hypothetical protein
MAKEFKWQFVIDPKGSHKAFNNSDLERFKINRYKSLAREVIQNSIDARDDKSKPVRVEFSTYTKETNEIPDRVGLLKKVTDCIPTAKKDRNRKEAEPWFNEAKKILEGKTDSYRVRICRTCSGLPVLLELGSYADLESALLINDAHELMQNRTKQLHLLTKGLV